jgi:predicted DNA-binding antitoxin AbrB/MazE fold protein
MGAKNIQRINKTKSWLMEKINEIDKPLKKLTKRMGEKTQIDKIRGKKEDIAKSNTNEIHRITRKYFENLHSNKLDNLKELDYFLYVYHLQN